MALVLLLVVAPLVELFVIIKTGQAIGVLNTIGLLILIAVIGSWLLKREGMKVWRRFAEQVQTGQTPTREIADGMCILLAGALMLAPGFVSDVIALLLLFPPTRALVRRRLMKRRGLGGLGNARVIRATYGGPIRDDRSGGVTDTTATESRGELDR